MVEDARCGATVFSEPVTTGKYHEQHVIEVQCSGHHGHHPYHHEGVRHDSGRVVTWRGLDDEQDKR